MVESSGLLNRFHAPRQVQATNPNPAQKVIYQALKVPSEVIEPVRAWYDPQSATSATSLAIDPALVPVGTN